MTTPLPDTWHTRELPVLRESIRIIDTAESSEAASEDLLSELTNLTVRDVRRAVANLERDQLITVLHTGGGVIDVMDFTGDALRHVGAWPTPETALDRMLAALEQIAVNGDTEDTRTKARKILDGFGGAGRTIGLSVAAATIHGQLPTT